MLSMGGRPIGSKAENSENVINDVHHQPPSHSFIRLRFAHSLLWKSKRCRLKIFSFDHNSPPKWSIPYPARTRAMAISCLLLSSSSRPATTMLATPRARDYEHQHDGRLRTGGAVVKNRHDAYSILLRSSVSSTVTHPDPRNRLPSVYA